MENNALDEGILDVTKDFFGNINTNNKKLRPNTIERLFGNLNLHINEPTNILILQRGYNYYNFIKIIKLINSFFKSKNILEVPSDVNRNVIEVFGKYISKLSIYIFIFIDNILTKFVGLYTLTKLGDLLSNRIYILLTSRDKQYVHCLIKTKYINSNPLLDIEYTNLNKLLSVDFKGLENTCRFCTFKDEYERYIVCYIEKDSDNKYFARIRKFTHTINNSIQIYESSITKPHIFYYKDVLDLKNIKNYIIISNFNSSCHILQLNRITKLFDLKKTIQNSNELVKVVPNDNLKENLIILYDCNNPNTTKDIYVLETDSVEKISVLFNFSNVFYHSYYDYNRFNFIENAFIVECSIDKVRLLYSNIAHKKFKTFQTNFKEKSLFTNAIIIENENSKQLYCIGSNRILYIFDYFNLKLMNVIVSNGLGIARLSMTSLLIYNNINENECEIFDINSRKTSKKILFTTKYTKFSDLNPILLISDIIYIVVTTSQNELIFHALDNKINY